jgi:hypothetical protein
MAGFGVVVVCANAPTGMAKAAISAAVVTEFFSVSVMSSRLPQQRCAARHAENEGSVRSIRLVE